MGLTFIIWIFLMMIFILPSLSIIKENERVVIFRLGRFYQIQGPGLAFALPFLDKKNKIDLDKCIPGWQGYQKDDLYKKIKEYVLSNLE
ncbi:MAG: hypothetical protein JXB49_18585 [Bacteroidales bacterium]|nr:hypothetical protein [Bacteroidales bacterium]